MATPSEAQKGSIVGSSHALDRIEERRRVRQAAKVARARTANHDRIDTEQVAAFTTSFVALESNVQTLLRHLAEAVALQQEREDQEVEHDEEHEAAAGELRRSSLDECAQTLAKLEELFTQASSLWLAKYDQEKFNARLEDLKQAVSDASVSSKPKRRLFAAARARRRTRMALQADGTTLSATKPGETDAASAAAVADRAASAQRDAKDSEWVKRLGIDAPSSNALQIADVTVKTVYHPAGSLQDRDVTISRVLSANVYLLDALSAVRVVSARNSQFFVGPVNGSVFVEKASDCTFYVACRQLRVHEATRCRFYLLVASDPVIEHSTDITVAPYMLEYPELTQQLESVNMASHAEPRKNRWDHVKDFGWHKNYQSPNWAVLPSEARHAVREEDIATVAKTHARGARDNEF